MQMCCSGAGTMAAAPVCACGCASVLLRLLQTCINTLITKQQASWRQDRQRSLAIKANGHVQEIFVKYVGCPSCLDLCRCSRNGRSTKVLHQLWPSLYATPQALSTRQMYCRSCHRCYRLRLCCQLAVTAATLQVWCPPNRNQGIWQLSFTSIVNAPHSALSRCRTKCEHLVNSQGTTSCLDKV